MPAIATVQDFRRAIRQGPNVWPGLYPLFFIHVNGDVTCHACATSERRNIIDGIGLGTTLRGDQLAGYDATCNVDGPIVCDTCGIDLTADA